MRCIDAQRIAAAELVVGAGQGGRGYDGTEFGAEFGAGLDVCDL